MRLPVVTRDNLAYCDGLRLGLTERREEMHQNVQRFPLELTMDNAHLQYRVVMCSIEEVDALVFGLTLLVNSVSDAVASGTYHTGRAETGVAALLRRRAARLIEKQLPRE